MDEMNGLLPATSFRHESRESILLVSLLYSFKALARGLWVIPPSDSVEYVAMNAKAAFFLSSTRWKNILPGTFRSRFLPPMYSSTFPSKADISLRYTSRRLAHIEATHSVFTNSEPCMNGTPAAILLRSEGSTSITTESLKVSRSGVRIRAFTNAEPTLCR